MEYKLVRSKRKTLALHITVDGLEVRAPLRMPVFEIERFVRSKERWIGKHLGEMSVGGDSEIAGRIRGGGNVGGGFAGRARDGDGAEGAGGAGDGLGNFGGGFALGYGDSVSFRGGLCPIVGLPAMNSARAGRARGQLLGGEFQISENLSPDNIRFILSRVLKSEAEKYIPQRVRHFAAIMGLRPDSVRITTAFGRWGSCSAKKRLNFAWMLMMADDEAIDSVVVHELAHMVYANHSQKFYNLVKKYYPNYEKHKKNLKELSKKIARERWKR